MNSILRKLGDFFALKVRKVLPDSFVFASLLTILTFIIAWSATGSGPQELMGMWLEGIFSENILSFAFFMIMVLSFGHSIGDSIAMRGFFNKLSNFIKTPTQVYLAIVFSSLILNLINWGLAPVTALFTVELCKRVKGVDFRLACAALYSGMLIWHGGLSSSAAVMMATESTASSFVENGLIESIIPISETLLQPLNLALIVSTFVVLPLVILALRPRYDERFDAALSVQSYDVPRVQDSGIEEEELSLADHLNNARPISWIMATLCFIGTIWIVSSKGFNLHSLSLLMLGGALIMQGSPIKLVRAMRDAIRGSSDIVIQFPLFGGIMQIFIASGLAVLFANGLLRLGDADTLPWLAFLCSGFVNLFIPSGGGEWLVLGPPLLQAANDVNADIGRTIIAFAYGDSLTNLMNPFWTLTFLPIMGSLMNIRTRDFMGYTVLICLLFFVLESILILWF